MSIGADDTTIEPERAKLIRENVAEEEKKL
jgi:hypothetical protein